MSRVTRPRPLLLVANTINRRCISGIVFGSGKWRKQSAALCEAGNVFVRDQRRQLYCPYCTFTLPNELQNHKTEAYLLVGASTQAECSELSSSKCIFQGQYMKTFFTERCITSHCHIPCGVTGLRQLKVVAYNASWVLLFVLQ